MAVVEAALVTLGADRDPECWISWGDDPAVRYLILAPTPTGLVQVSIRVNVAGEGPRASGKVVRWSHVQLSELGVEIQGGHRLVSFQVETHVLNGVDDAADRISAFALALYAAVDGRPAPPALKQKATPKAVKGSSARGATLARTGKVPRPAGTAVRPAGTSARPTGTARAEAKPARSEAKPARATAAKGRTR
jgi:hypothetical protein